MKDLIQARIAEGTLKEIDKLVIKGNYINRAEFLRDAVKEKLRREVYG
jgi:Arc/MetJ-type ribon-helix-helix transcriptional regulator